jgi:hypothetical protein
MFPRLWRPEGVGCFIEFEVGEDKASLKGDRNEIEMKFQLGKVSEGAG